ncbi:MAG TPA: hypothetical protein VK437_07065 [Steroidobacteraceae bacterium]|nr:hypothetical protein [Steroidobacteraceae bacterium]
MRIGSSESEPSLEAERRLEQLIDRTLADLPLRRAPSTLEARVFDEIERRAALPWWRQGFGCWPQIARAVFLAACAALCAAAILAGAWALGRIGRAGEMLTDSWVRGLLTLEGAARETAGSLARIVPLEWVYEGLILSAVLYACLFGVSAAAYRMLYLKSELAGRS